MSEKFKVIRLCMAPPGGEDHPMLSLVPVSDLNCDADTFIEGQKKVSIDTGTPVEIEVHEVSGSFYSPENIKNVIEVCLEQAGGMEAISTRLSFRNTFIGWILAQVERLTATGVICLKDPPPREYRLKDLEDDIRIVGAKMLSTQKLIVPCKFDDAQDKEIRTLTWMNNQLERDLLH